VRGQQVLIQKSRGTFCAKGRGSVVGANLPFSRGKGRGGSEITRKVLQGIVFSINSIAFLLRKWERCGGGPAPFRIEAPTSSNVFIGPHGASPTKWGRPQKGRLWRAEGWVPGAVLNLNAVYGRKEDSYTGGRRLTSGDGSPKKKGRGGLNLGFVPTLVYWGRNTALGQKQSKVWREGSGGAESYFGSFFGALTFGLQLSPRVVLAFVGERRTRPDRFNKRRPTLGEVS